VGFGPVRAPAARGKAGVRALLPSELLPSKPLPRLSVCLSACRGLGSVVGPLLAARALPLRCAASDSANFYTGYA
jgi:hypothetical protein